MRRLGTLVPFSLVALGAPAVLQAPLNPYDGGILLTLARFTSFSMLPYRDLWTLYGPGPPLFGSLITDLFGPGLMPLRLGYVLLHGFLVAAVYAFARRFVPWLTALILALPIATFAYSPSHFHFAMSSSLVLWGLWFLVRDSEEDSQRIGWRSYLGTSLIGLSFLGRYEYAVLALPMVLLIWWYLRSKTQHRGAWLLLSGLAPIVLFALFLSTVVGISRVNLNLIDYPFRLYPKPFCRGLPDVWGSASAAFLAPFRGHLWTGQELTLWAGTYLPPLLGGLVLLAGIRRRLVLKSNSGVYVVVGLVTIFVWLEMRPRAAAEPHPTWPLMVACVALLAARLRDGRRIASMALPAALGIVFVFSMAISWAPAIGSSLFRWPSYDSRFGFARVDDDPIFNDKVWSEVTNTVHRFAKRDAPIFVALTQNTGHHANMPIFYWLTDRPPASRFIELIPCLTDTERVQHEIVQEIEDANVVIATAYFGNPPPPLGPPATVLDEYLAENFSPVYRGTVLFENDVSVLVREKA